MKNIILLICFLTVIYNSQSYSQQNFVSNNSFETSANWAFYENAHFFGSGLSFDYVNWFNGNYNDAYSISAGVPDNYFGSQTAFDGNRYVAIWCEQHSDDSKSVHWPPTYGYTGIELTTNLTNGIEYIIQFKISKMDNTETADYEVELASGITGENKPSGSTTIREASISNASSWETVTIYYTPSNSNYSYIFFSSDNLWMFGTDHLAGFYLDDIVVAERCKYDHPCSTTAGGITPLTGNNPCGQHNPFYLTNLYNVISANIVIHNSIGTEIRHLEETSVNGLSYPIYWDGKDDLGDEVAQGTYRLIYNFQNDCFSESIDLNHSIPIVKQTGSAYLTECPNCNHPPYNNSIKVPLACCSYIPDINLSSTTISGAGDLEFVAQNNISASSIILNSDATSVVFKATNGITLTTGFHAMYGCSFTAQIESCTPGFLKKRFPENELLSVNDINLSENLNIFERNSQGVYNDSLEENNPQNIKLENSLLLPSSIKEFNIELHPNPTKGIVEISLNNTNNSEVLLQIVNIATGVVLYNQSILNNNFNLDFSQYAAGVYSVKAITDYGVIVKKLVKE